MPTDAELPSLPLLVTLDLQQEVRARVLNFLAAQTPEQRQQAAELMRAEQYMPDMRRRRGGLQFVSADVAPDNPFAVLVHVAGYRQVRFTF